MRVMSRLMVLIVGVVLVTSVVPVAAVVPPCDKLLTMQDVIKAVGPGFKIPPKETTVMAGPGCFFSRTTQQADSRTLQEDIWLAPQEIPGGAALKLAEVSSGYRMSGAPVVAASGLGPNAFYLEDKGTGSTDVRFGKGNLLVYISYKVVGAIGPP